MNQETFLNQLEGLLSDIPEDERREALEYYRCYFEDAGIENEESVLEELVSPERVAQTIKADLQGDIADGGFTERGYEEFTEKSVPGTKEQIADDEKKQTGHTEEKTRSSYTDVWKKMPDPNQYGQSGNYRRTYEESGQKQDREYQENSGQSHEQRREYQDQRRQYHEERRRHHEQRRRSSGSLVGKAFAIFGIGIAIIAVVIALVAVAIGLIAATVAVGGAAVGLMGVAIGLFVSGAFATALALLGSGFICLAFFFLLLLAVVAVCGKALPTALRSICNAAGDILFDRGEDAR